LANILLRKSRVARACLNVDVPQLFLYDTQVLGATQQLCGTGFYVPYAPIAQHNSSSPYEDLKFQGSDKQLMSRRTQGDRT